MLVVSLELSYLKTLNAFTIIHRKEIKKQKQR